jgi:hypothetical protein
MVRHGRSLALSVAVNVAPSRLCTGRYSAEVQDMILSNAVADRVRPSESHAVLPLSQIDLYSHHLAAHRGIPHLGGPSLGSSFTLTRSWDQ